MSQTGSNSRVYNHAAHPQTFDLQLSLHIPAKNNLIDNLQKSLTHFLTLPYNPPIVANLSSRCMP